MPSVERVQDRIVEVAERRRVHLGKYPEGMVSRTRLPDRVVQRDMRGRHGEVLHVDAGKVLSVRVSRTFQYCQGHGTPARLLGGGLNHPIPDRRDTERTFAGRCASRTLESFWRPTDGQTSEVQQN